MADTIAIEDFAPVVEISCDRCIAPGTCCKAFPLSHPWKLGSTPEEILQELQSFKVPGPQLPFLPLRRINFTKSGREEWLFTCPKLGEDGRCTIYEDRPWTCKVYEPGVDLMCVHMRGPDNAPIVPQLPILQ